jgi:hypothetical protein
MLNPDFSDRTYTAEVIRVRTHHDEAVRALSRLTIEPRPAFEPADRVDSSINVIHAYFPSRRQFHRVERFVTADSGQRVQVPRRIERRGSENYLYDVLIAHSRDHIVVAVPFHDLAEEFFVQGDRAIAGTGARYEKVDITGLVIRLGTSGVIEVPDADLNESVISVTRCQLAYTDREGRSRDLQQIQITGANLGASKQYQYLIRPVIAPRPKDKLRATPLILGFALSVAGVRKCSAVTDRHGNFKVWVSPGLRRLIRLFSLLDAIYAVKNIASTTANVPILQSGTIRGAENQ